MANSVFDTLKTKINEQLSVIEDALVTNGAKSIEDYRHMTGQFRGLTVALNYIKDLENRYINDDLDD